MKRNLLIGAISGNYTVDDVRTWVETSIWDDTNRLLLLYNDNEELVNYLTNNDIGVIQVPYDSWGQKTEFTTNTGTMTLQSSYNLVHNIRFFHIWDYINNSLQQGTVDKVLITDVRDVYFNKNPFEYIDNNIIATSEVVVYEQEQWNSQHLYENLGLIGIDCLLTEEVLNVGVWGGPIDLVRDMCADIYLMSAGKPKVADQTSFNYLIRTKYKNTSKITGLDTEFAVHLHVINAGLVPFDLNNIKNFSIVHQYDRIPGFTR